MPPASIHKVSVYTLAMQIGLDAVHTILHKACYSEQYMQVSRLLLRLQTTDGLALTHFRQIVGCYCDRGRAGIGTGLSAAKVSVNRLRASVFAARASTTRSCNSKQKNSMES